MGCIWNSSKLCDRPNFACFSYGNWFRQPRIDLCATNYFVYPRLFCLALRQRYLSNLPNFLVGNFSCELNEVKEYPVNFPPFDLTVLCFMANEKTSIVFVLWTDSKNESGISSPGALLSRFQHFPQFWKKVFFMHKVNTRKVMASNY